MRGAVRLKSFTAEPEDVGSYGPLQDESGERVFEVTVIGMSAGNVLARIEGVGDRDAAEALRGTRLYVARSALPEPEEDEFYHGDLLGLRAETEDGSPVGTIIAVFEAGGGDVIEIDPEEGRTTLLVPFTREAVPVVDLAAGRVVVVPPEGDGDAEDGAP